MVKTSGISMGRAIQPGISALFVDGAVDGSNEGTSEGCMEGLLDEISGVAFFLFFGLFEPNSKVE
jgi:hypothetical protein